MRQRVPVLVYDAECGFCRRWIARWRRSTAGHVQYVPYQSAWLFWRLGVRKRDARRAAQLVEPDGSQSSGAAAIFRALRHARAPSVRMFARMGLLPGLRSLAELAYRFIAAHRVGASRVQRAFDRLFVGQAARRGRFWRALSRPGLASRGLGVVYVIAFLSLRRQVLGLYGSRGIRPIREHLERVARELPSASGTGLRKWPSRLRAVPSLLWFGASDAALVRLCRVGALAGAALAFGIRSRIAALVAWCGYLSFVSAGGEFLRFQWDALLLESGLHAVLGGRHRRGLMRVLAFRLQFESGIAKLASGDRAWRTLSACVYHQETQPLPTPLGWYAHHLPRRVQHLATALTLFVECAGPAFALGPRRTREAAFAVLTGFQVLIALTGNFAFFNWLTAVLNLTILEDRPDSGEAASAVVAAVDTLAAGPLAALALVDLAQTLRPRLSMPRLLDRMGSALAPLHAVSSYGLFAAMTTNRREIVIEGSDDGETWREYGFRYKPGDVMHPPRWVAPHQPRLDWQMWFAALACPPGWFTRLLGRLLEGSPDVLALLGENPFPDRPPRFVRALLYEYRIADFQTHRRTGAWWARAPLAMYFPPCTLPAHAQPSSQMVDRPGDHRSRP